MRWFLANELANPRDIVKGKGQGKGSVPATKSRLRLGQQEHCTSPHFDDSRQPLRLNLPSSMKQDWERNPRRLSRPYLHRDPSSSSPPTVTVVPPAPPQYSSSCLSMTDHSRSASTLLAAAAIPSLNLPQPATVVAKQPHQDYQPPPTLPRSDRQPQQPSPPLPLELLPYSTPGPSQPLQPLPETAPLLDSNCLPQADVPSLRTKERQTDLQNVDKYGSINNVVPCSHDVVGEKNIVEDK
ncbi:classical arabinogalactan protein 9-like [Salvia hispanica]|uniref:classical arabinogalactan protein 9-like n=1 Tax=Salvia hispanica TaxID=49212 RepID=UPI00200926D9|nr:classical arabinogalactan protein 9-like [Salvia hispanica]